MNLQNSNTYVQIARSGQQAYFCYNSVKELYKIIKKGKFYDYDAPIPPNMKSLFLHQSIFELLDFIYAYVNNHDSTSLSHHALAFSVCRWFPECNKLSDGILISLGLTNQFTALGFNLYKIMKGTNIKNKSFLNRINLWVTLICQTCYRVPIIIVIIHYAVKHAMKKGIVKTGLLVRLVLPLIQLYNELAWIRWTIRKLNIIPKKYVNGVSYIIIVVLMIVYIKYCAKYMNEIDKQITEK